MKNKLIGILIILILLIVAMAPSIFAAYGGINTNINIGSTNAINSSKRVTERIVGILQVCGSVISVVALIIIGMRYMFSSVDERAQIKGMWWYYIIGAILVFGTTNVMGIVYSIISKLSY